eukprot:Skav224904  [mRNA]  locus=scaffold1112:436912:441234:- [translate_table: standard]
MCANQLDPGTHVSAPAAAPAASPSPAASAKGPPKEIPPDALKKLIQDFESQKIHNQARVFPIRSLLGAEKVVARVWWEHQHKAHTPLGLHEILITRYFDAAGNANPLAQQTAQEKPNKAKVTLDLNTQAILVNDDMSWSPKGLLSLMDALEATQHCWTLVQLGHELEVANYISWWKQLFRSRSSRLDQLKTYWLDAGWRMALELRNGTDFGTIAEQIMQDQFALQAALARDPPAMPKNKPQAPPKAPWKNPQSQQANPGKRRTWEASPGSWQAKKSSNADYYKSNAYQQQKPSGGTGGTPSQTDPPDRHRSPTDLILLSVFDGIGCARVALDQLKDKLPLKIHYFAWEIDEQCTELTSRHFDVHHRGDFRDDNLDDLIQRLDELDPHQSTPVLLTAGPPCPDYSRILGDNGQGRAGQEGIKSEQFCTWQRDLCQRLQPRPVGRLVENVIPHRRADIKHFEDGLSCQAIIFDSCEFKRVSRPRVWWSDIRWTDPTTDKVFGSGLKWTRHFGTWRLNAPQPTTAVTIPDGWSAPSCWSKNQQLHCLTTPAPTPEGRAAPRSMKGKMSSATHNRWVAAGRLFAPWHYEDDHVMKSPSGELTTAPIETKESLHELPVGFTEGFDTTTRHRMVANSWHTGVARLLLWVLLLQMGAQATAHRPPRGTSFDALHYMKGLWVQPMQHGPGPLQPLASGEVEKLTDMREHWDQAGRLGHPAAEQTQLDPGLRQVLTIREQLPMDLNRLRHRVCDEVCSMKEVLAETTEEWFDTLPSHVRKLYHSPTAALQVPLMRTLSSEFHWGDDTLLKELEEGFPLLGRLQAGWGWPLRSDDRYSHPLAMMDFFVENEKYIHRKMKNRRTDPHWQHLALDIAEEVRMGRMEGPFTAPPSWPGKTVPLDLCEHTGRLHPGPTRHVSTSVAFSIMQVGADGKEKIRRGEDWRRGLQNQTVQVVDAPVNHRAPAFVALAQALADKNIQTMVWATDQEDAYRQLPVAEPQHCYTLLFTANGATLWRHRCLLFGATGSVWSYGRTSDWMMFMARCLLLGGNMHYVDDFAAVEPRESATSSFVCSHRLWETIGFRFKKSKVQPPDTEHRIQGIIMKITKESFTLSPDPDRLQRMVTRLKEVLLDGRLSADEAARTAGKLQFLTETLSGQAMKACLVNMYAQAHHSNADDTIGLGLRDSIQTIIFILEHLQPKVHVFSQPQAAILYADAYLLAGDKKVSLSTAMDMDWPDLTHSLMENGWGWVLRTPNGVTYYSFGRIPQNLTKHFTTRNAFIYAFEIIAQILPLVSCRLWIPPAVWCWCDNQAGKAALQKGYGKDKKINHLLSMFWSYATMANLDPHWRRVCSQANISDPISRQDITIAIEKGWVHVECDWEAIYMLLLEGNKSTSAALATAPKLLDCTGFISQALQHGEARNRANMVED